MSVWISRSDWPSDCGWCAVDRLTSLPSTRDSSRQNRAVMRGSRSLTMLFGMPCGPMMVRSVVPASCTEPSVVRVAAKRFSFVSRSTYTWMASKPRFDRGSPLTASVVQCRHGSSGSGSGISRPGLSCLLCLLRWHASHVSTYCSTSPAMPRQSKRRCASASMRSRPQCAPVALSCSSARMRVRSAASAGTRIRPCSPNSRPRLACHPVAATAASAGIRRQPLLLGAPRSTAPPVPPVVRSARARCARRQRHHTCGGRPGALAAAASAAGAATALLPALAEPLLG